MLLFWNRMAQRAMSSDVGLEHVAGAENAKREVNEVIEFLKDPERFRKLGAKIPRALTPGATSQLPDEERYNYPQSYLKDRIAVMFGGRLAESIVFGEVSNGAENDLEEATRLARRMIGRWGMSERLGPTSFTESDQHVFLGREMAQGRNHSEATAAAIDEEIRSLLKDIEDQARILLEDNRDSLDALAEALAEDETLESDRVRQIIEESGG